MVVAEYSCLTTLPDRGRTACGHTEMSFDPLPVFGRVRVPTLLVYGGDDIWVPVEESLANSAVTRHPGTDVSRNS